jgi:predicted hydrocarbon binding protein
MSENPILDGLSYDKSSGALRYKGVRYLLIRPETITGFQKAVSESWGEGADEKLFAGGFAGGSLSSKKYRELHHFTDYEIIEFMMNMGNQIGWGSFNLERYDPQEKRLRVSVAYSPFAESYGSSSMGVCHLIRGVLAGMASVIFETDCTSTETECLAKGDQRCLFVIEEKRIAHGA